ncbi:MAG TPA: CoA transferase, partial [Tepidiformaceae bacterium]|nr:CoA transferase [Tepidiformaceae bacterium]
MPAALHGVRVLELAEGVSGPYCGKLLAGLGADVVKLEPAAGDSTRREGPFPGDVPDPERSGLFLHLNTGKRGVTGDVELPRLLADADAVIVGLRPAELAPRGIDFAAWQRAFPRLV